MIEKIKYWWKVIRTLNPIAVRNLFWHVHQFRDFDPSLKGYKYAILYGRLYFERSRYKPDGTLDREERSKRIDRIMVEYYNPTDRKKYIKAIKKLKDGVEYANALGYFSVGENAKQNEIEAINYQMAIDSLNQLIAASTIYIWTWERIFRQPCEHVH